jgi:hypothetical protein
MSAITNPLPKPVDNFSTQISSATISPTAITFTVEDATGLPTEGVGVFFKKDSDGQVVTGSVEFIHWTGVSSNTITLTDVNDRGLDGSDSGAQSYVAGDFFEVWVTSYYYQSQSDALLNEHDTGGEHDISAMITNGSVLDEDDMASNSATALATQQSIKAYVDNGQVNSLNQQAIINGNFVVNQRAYVSNATLSAGAYGHDRWKAGGSGGDYTFTQLPNSTQITIKSGKSLIQVIEDKNVVGGEYTLSWEGTAQARFGINSATPSGSYAASPITIDTQTAGTVMSIEFNEGTLGKVQLNAGSVALPFQPKSYEEELRACQRYATVIPSTRERMLNTDGSNFDVGIQLINQMRITPTLETGGTEVTDWQIYNASSTAQTGFTLSVSTSSRNGALLRFTKVTHGLTDGFVFFKTEKTILTAEL